MHNFDQFIGVDWSGAKAPIKTKSIAVASLSKEKDDLTLHQNIRSRSAVANFIGNVIKGGKRTLIGIDCNFGYAVEILRKQIGQNATAPDLWAKVDDVNAENPNLFAGDFWMHPKFKEDFWTTGKMPINFQMPKRMTEIICADNGYGRPESPFKLIGAKQVGKGGLAGMRMAHILKQKYGSKVAIWPFDNDQSCDLAVVVLTEIYPRQFIMRAAMGSQKIRKDNDLKKILEFYGLTNQKHKNFTDHDTDALVSAAGLRYLCGMNQTIPNTISNPSRMTKTAQSCEGWIFGVGDIE